MLERSLNAGENSLMWVKLCEMRVNLGLKKYAGEKIKMRVTPAQCG